MRVSFYAAAILALAGLTTVEAIAIEGHDFDFGDYEFAEIDGNMKSESNGESDSMADAVAEIMSRAAADADCEETVNGVTLRLSTPECTQEPAKAEVPFDQQMLLALQELSGKSMTLYEALKAQFAKSNAL